MHEILLDSVCGNNKEPGKIRTIQNWIVPNGCTIEEAIFIPPSPEDVPILLDNLFNYMNNLYIDPLFINMEIFHSQFETIHAYRDGNGRLGRALIPIQLSLLTNIETLNSNAIYRIMPAIMHQIVFTKKEIEDESGVSRNTVSTLIDKLEEIGILVTDSTYAKLGYRYNEIYNVFVGKNII